MAYVTAEGDDSHVLEVAEAWSDIALDSNTVERTAYRRCAHMFVALSQLSETAHWYMVPEELHGRRFKGVCIVGAGHSLDRELETLERLRARGVLIVATNTASAAIEPDMVGYLESGNYTNTVCAGVPLLAEMTSFPIAGKHAWFQSLDPAFDQWALQQRLMPIEIGPSVTSALMSWAVAVGFQQIVLVGTDLGCDGGPRYSAHSPYADRIRTIQSAMLPRVGGGTIESNIIFRDELEWFERYAARRPSGVRFIDTAFAAKKAGFDDIRLEYVSFAEDVNPGDRALLVSDRDVREWLDETRLGLEQLRLAAEHRDHWEVRAGLRRHLFMDALMYADLLQMEHYTTSRDKHQFLLDCVAQRASEAIEWI
jgi:hypothetical protein